MKRNNLAIIFVALLASPSCFAVETPKDFPEGLLFRNKPIDSLCIFEGTKITNAIELNQCGVTSEKGRMIDGYEDSLIAKNYVGYDYVWPMEGVGLARGFSYYKPYGKVGENYIIFAINNSGGSGEFTAINLVKREKDALRVQTLLEGDRCNNGIDEVTNENNKLTYTVNITAFDFLEIAKDNPNNLQAYRDLESCAACCKATAIFERDLAKFEDEKLSYIDLDAYALDSSSRQGKYQTCFDELMAKYKTAGKSHLTLNDLKEFTREFNDTCVIKKK